MAREPFVVIKHSYILLTYYTPKITIYREFQKSPPTIKHFLLSPLSKSPHSSQMNHLPHSSKRNTIVRSVPNIYRRSRSLAINEPRFNSQACSSSLYWLTSRQLFSVACVRVRGRSSSRAAKPEEERARISLVCMCVCVCRTIKFPSDSHKFSRVASESLRVQAVASV